MVIARGNIITVNGYGRLCASHPAAVPSPHATRTSPLENQANTCPWKRVKTNFIFTVGSAGQAASPSLAPSPFVPVAFAAPILSDDARRRRIPQRSAAATKQQQFQNFKCMFKGWRRDPWHIISQHPIERCAEMPRTPERV